MAATFIQITLDDFEAQFNMPHKKNPSQRAFELIRPKSSEAFYTCLIKSNDKGSLVLKVLTTCEAGRRKARASGEDAIRCYVLWMDNNGWEAVVGKTNRTYRSGGVNATAADVVSRTLDKCRKAVRETFKSCPKCGRPMVLRESKSGHKFYGCCAFSNEGCKGTVK